MRTPTSYGICEACGSRTSKAAMTAHLRKCLVAKPGDVPSEGLLFRVQSPGAPMFWLDCAATPEAKLKDLDNLLRRTWLECCGHLSEFYGAGRRKLPMSTTIGRVFAASAKGLHYEYDFGSTTALVITSSGVLDARRGKPVRVVARNEPPTWPCDYCGQPATTICAQCLYDGRGFCCAVHAKKHSCGEEMLLPVVNSPRMGVCGYTGEG
jgi:hypothetical protein